MTSWSWMPGTEAMILKAKTSKKNAKGAFNSLLQQLKDIIPLALVASAMGIVVLLVIQTFDASSTQLIVGTIVGIIVYSILALLFFRDILKELKSLMLSRRSE